MALMRTVVLLATSIAATSVVRAQSTECAPARAQLLGAQATLIGQRLQPLRSPYAGAMSLRADGDRQLSQSYGAYGGLCIGGGLDVYLDAEMVRGSGISHASGLGAVTNGDVLRQGSVDLGSAPYVARVFARWTIGLRGAERDTLTRATDQRPTSVPARRVEVQAGKFALSDLFDVNRYANSGRTQFLNWVLFQNGAWDFAADTRGYTLGAAVSWITPAFTVRAASAEMPRFANGNTFDGDVSKARGDEIELTLPLSCGAIVRMLAWQNRARMGRYATATARGDSTRTTPDIVADDAPGRQKSGFGINAEMPLADAGETGVFARWGWSDGKNESFAFTEVDRHASVGGQVSGTRWSRSDDRFGAAFALDGLSADHRAYLAAGGRGFLLGDGRLNYGPEQLIEAYYAARMSRGITVSPDVQYVRNPGYNRDRGPATVLTARVRAAW